MPRSVILALVALTLFGAANAQELDLSHPLYQEEMQSWDYGLLMDCSIKYEITVDIYKGLANNPDHFKEAIARHNALSRSRLRESDSRSRRTTRDPPLPA